MFEAQTTVCACRLALLSAGSRMPISTAMMPMTTRSSTSVNPSRRFVEFVSMTHDPFLLADGVLGPAHCECRSTPLAVNLQYYGWNLSSQLVSIAFFAIA